MKRRRKNASVSTNRGERVWRMRKPLFRAVGRKKVGGKTGYCEKVWRIAQWESTNREQWTDSSMALKLRRHSLFGSPCIILPSPCPSTTYNAPLRLSLSSPPISSPFYSLASGEYSWHFSHFSWVFCDSQEVEQSTGALEATSLFPQGC